MKQVKRCPCEVTFRFGNHGVLQSKHAIVVPIHGVLLKIAIVPGNTPFLLSNTLLRALGASVDTTKHVIHASKIQKSFPMTLTSKGLFLLDLNDLVRPEDDASPNFRPAETHATVCVQPEPLPAEADTRVPRKETIVADDDDRDSHVDDEIGNKHELSSEDNSKHEIGCQPHSEAELPMPVCMPLDSRVHSTNTSSCIDRSKSVPRSFQAIPREGHGHVVPATAEGPRGAHRDQDRLRPVLHGTTGEHQDSVWKSSCGQNLSPHVVSRAKLGAVVHAALSPQCQVGTPPVPSLCGQEDRAVRTDRHTSANDQRQQPTVDSTGGGGHSSSHAQGQVSGDHPGGNSEQRLGLRGGSRALRSGSGPGSGEQQPGDPDGSPYDQHGERHQPDRAAPRGSGTVSCSRAVSQDECPSIRASLEAGDLSSECVYVNESQYTPESNRERSHLQSLVQKFSQEFRSVVQQYDGNLGKKAPLDVLEVFCGPQSQLTHQSTKLGYRAERFGLSQGDLQTRSGRELLYLKVHEHRPKNIWFSPTCGPWSGVSCLNGSRSVEAWDELQQVRMKHLEQIALGIVLLRHQRQQGRHMHWEQPKDSLMFKLPYLQEVFYYMLVVDVDLCVAGDLRDPENGKLIRKGLTILSTSQSMIQGLTGLRCPGNHEHQVIEGQVKVQGQWINRSSFTENYPRKFARRLAMIMGKVHVPKEMPYNNEVWPMLAAEEHPEAPEPKRPCLRKYASAKLSRTRPVTELPWGKRQKCVGKTSPIDFSLEWQQVFEKVQNILPRVGKRCLEDPEVLNMIQALVPSMQVVTVMACRGASRTLAPPENIMRGIAPLRRSIFSERGTGELRAEEEWEPWEDLAKRNLIRPSHATRVNITMFAKPRDMPRPDNPGTQSHGRDLSSLSAPTGAEHATNSESLGQPTETEVDLQDNSVPERISMPPAGLSHAQNADLQSAKQSSRFKALPKDEQIALLRAHKNLGHPSPERLSTLLRSQGFRAEIAQAAMELKCSTCQAASLPKLARPGSIRDELDFNDRICMDGLEWTNQQGTKFHVYHVVDWSTNFQCARVSQERTSQAVIRHLLEMWFSWAGSPSELIVDSGTEFNSEEFAVFVQANNIHLTTISPEAQYQNGKAERHGAVLKSMLSKYESEHPIQNHHDLSEALFWCIRAKNASSLKKGYAPEVLVLGKHTRLPGAVCSDEMLPAHLLMDSETSHGIAFRKQLAYRETARRAFFHADNDASLRRAMLRRSRPGGQQYLPGEWVMIWKQGKGALPGSWTGPMKVVVHENSQTIWTTMACKLYRCAPEHVRPVTAQETQNIPLGRNEPSVSQIASQLQHTISQGITRAINMPVEIPIQLEPTHSNASPPEDQSEGQPDGEPEIPSHQSTQSTFSHTPNPDNNPELNNTNGPLNPESTVTNDPAINTPVPDDADDDLMCEGLVCLDDDVCAFHDVPDLAWRCEITVSDRDIQAWKSEDDVSGMAFAVSAAKKQRSEVRLSTLTATEKQEFKKAKMAEVQNWLKTGTISKILRDQVPADQILRCRWVLTWKPIDPSEIKIGGPSQKAKARLVILGYLDPELENLPRDSPTLGRNSKLLLLQLIASKGWLLQSFDIRAAFLQGKPQTNRVLAIEPVEELIEALQLRTNQVCKLEKGAYGLIDAPYQWFLAISEELKSLGFSQSPFDPCQFLLRHHEYGTLEGILGLHVDDGICGGSEYFNSKIACLEKKYPCGSKKMKQFTFTGIEMDQLANGTITMKQSTYVKAINPIKISQDRRQQAEDKVSEEERQSLRGLIGSLQYAAVHTRPDLASRLSMLQSDINRATVNTLISANQALHEAKKYHDTTIQIQPIPVEDFRFLAFSDASFASKTNPSSHTGCMIMGTHKLISENVSCPVSPIAWGCKKIQRVVTSTLAAETVSLSSVLDHLSWLRLCWAWMLDPATNWKQPTTTLRSLPETYTTATYKSQNLPDSVAATDCKSLFDLVTRTATPNCAEYRTQLNARSIKDFLSEGVQLRWVVLNLQTVLLKSWKPRFYVKLCGWDGIDSMMNLKF